MTQSFSLTPKQSELRDLLAGAAKHSLLYGGSRSGKTFLICYAIATRALMAPKSRHAIFRRHGVAVKQSIGYDTLPKVLGLAYPQSRQKWHDQDGVFRMANGSEIWLAGLDDKERVDKILGKEFATLYFNEASEVPLASYDVAQTRLAQKVATIDGRLLPLRDYVDLNPTVSAHWTYRLFIDKHHPEGGPVANPDDYQVGVANPADNADNLTSDYLESLKAMPERQRRRFWDGVFSSDDADALWRREFIRRADTPESMFRVVVAIDPAATNNPGSDETGIIAMGVGPDGNGYVLEDASGRYRPEEWARAALALYDRHAASLIVAEVNNGGDMVESMLRSQREHVPYRAVRASRGKVTRAEPVAALYELGKVFHCGEFGNLEDQMCAFTLGYDRRSSGVSPDRVDALVWAATDLFPEVAGDLPNPELYGMRARKSGGWLAA